MSDTPAMGLPSAEEIRVRLTESLQPTVIEVVDETYLHAGHAGAAPAGFGTHFRVRIASPLFTGKSRVAQHRLVYDPLHEFMDRGLHALAIEVL